MVINNSKPNLGSKSKLLRDDFDPWYVLLSAPEVIEHENHRSFIVQPKLPKKSIQIDYKGLVKEAEHQGDLIIRERWRELRPLSPAKQLATILSSRSFRNGNAFDVKNYLTSTFENAKDKIQFTLPSFPFKIPNPLKTWHHNLDAGEILCLERLYLISYLAQELLDKPAEFIVISDGLIYSDICEIDPFEHKAYSQKAKSVIEKMGITENIKYVDMVDDVLEDRFNEYLETFDEVCSELKLWWSEHRTTPKVRYLINNMAANIKTNDLDYSVLRAMSHENAPQLFDDYSKVARKRAEDIAFLFTVKLVTLWIMDAVIQRYEGCVRSTVHPKQGQYGIHLVNPNSRVFPWQGVVLKKETGEFRTLASQDAWERARLEVLDSESGDFLYYAEKDSELGGPL